MLRKFSSLLRRGFAKKLSDDELTKQIENNYKKLYQAYDHKPKDIQTFRKQLIFRSKNLGMKELDLLIGKWAESNVQSLKEDELLRFESEVLHLETPDLYKMLTGTRRDFDELDYPKNHYLTLIKDFSERPDWNIQK
jgi:succinate dehydrogenase flavin-adding protein (antitoxin of CptAB toxin-antitoxin module)